MCVYLFYRPRWANERANSRRVTHLAQDDVLQRGDEADPLVIHEPHDELSHVGGLAHVE